MAKITGASIKTGAKRAWGAVKLNSGKEYLLAVQHLFAMFGATILVPLLTGMNASVALVTAGLGTLMFHLVTKGIVPVFLGSSFAFIAAITAITSMGTGNPADVTAEGVQLAQGGIIVAGVIYGILSLIVYFVGAKRIRKLFPPIVVGPVIVVIGMSLASVGVADASGANTVNAGMPNGVAPTWLCWLIAAVVVAVVIFFNVTRLKGKFIGILKVIPILLGIGIGYALCAILGACGVFHMDYSPFQSNDWFNIPYVSQNSNGIPFFSLPIFNLTAIITIAPIALVTFMEHIGDITTNGAVVGKNFLVDPGLHRTVLGDGVATAIAGFLGGPCNTTYGENTGVLATTGNYNPKIIRWTAFIAIFLGFFGKFGAILETIPVPVKGGIELVLYGMIASIGIRNMVENKVNMMKFRNIVVVALILVLGLGISSVSIKFTDTFTLSISGLFIATVVGVVVNAVLPEKDTYGEEKDAKIQEDVQKEIEEVRDYANTSDAKKAEDSEVKEVAAESEQTDCDATAAESEQTECDVTASENVSETK